MERAKLLAVIAVWPLLLIVGCSEMLCIGPPPEPVQAREPAYEPSPPPPAPQPVRTDPCAEMGRPVHTSLSATSGQPADNLAAMEKITPATVRTNQTFEYQLKVTNLTQHPLNNVVVTDGVPEHLEVKSCEPEMHTMQEGQASWHLGTIEADSSRTINVNAVATAARAITTCAEVTYECPLCANIDVVEPKIELAKSCAADVLVCDRIPLKYVIKNTGTGPACNVTITDPLTSELVTAKGESKVTFDVGTLMPGEQKEYSVMVNPTKTGEFASKATATSEGDFGAESAITRISVKQPRLAINQSGPEMRYIGRTLIYEINLANKGDGIAKDTVLEAQVPDCYRFSSATAGGTFSKASPGRVLWKLGSMQPDASKKVTMTFVADEPGRFTVKAAARAECADTVSTDVMTMLEGVPAVLLEVVDVSDPIEVGANETYRITVTNQGSATDTNIRVKCTLEPAMQYLSSTGPTSGTVQDNTITFAPLARLAPKEKATWQVTVRALNSGDVRFSTTLKTDELQRPVEETEATRFYE